jgi:hypothetical protein
VNEIEMCIERLGDCKSGLEYRIVGFRAADGYEDGLHFGTISNTGVSLSAMPSGGFDASQI